MQRLTYESREAWLADRPNRIGASESPGILGYGYANESALATYAKKSDPTLEEVIDETDRQRMEAGTLMEPVIQELFRRASGLVVAVDPTLIVCVSSERPHVGCTLDGELVDDDGPAVWQAKNVGEYMAHDWENGSLPMRVQIQTQHEMYATGYPRAYIAALIGGNRLVWKRTDRNERFIRAMLPVLDSFWQCVQNRQPPPPDESRATAEALKRLYAEEHGETIQLPPDAATWDTDLLAIKDTIKELEATKRGLENQIKAALKDAAYGEIPGGGRYSWKTSIRHEAAREAREVSIRTLRRLKR